MAQQQKAIYPSLVANVNDDGHLIDGSNRHFALEDVDNDSGSHHSVTQSLVVDSQATEI